MNATITIGDAVLIAIGIFAVILLINLCRMAAASIPAIKALTKILEDTSTLTGTVSDAVDNAEGTIKSLTDSTSEMAEFIANNQSVFKAIISLINSVNALRQIFMGARKDKK